MRLEEYERVGKATYAGLAEVIGKILSAAIAAVPDLHPQQVQHRAKDTASLRKKLARSGAAEADEIEPHAKDLAGARVIFYTNSDVTRFQNSGILTDNFEVDWERTRFHHPTDAQAGASELFVSNNYVVRLKDERAALPEYAQFAGLWCEVQVQTTLNHAWAEMAHDTIYKKPQLTGFGSDLMKGIEVRMAAIMRDYLAPAGYAFQKVLSDVERLSRGQALFEQGVVQSIEDAATNNDLHQALSNFHSSVLPYYDDWREGSGEILQAVVRAVARSRSMPAEPRQTPFGDLEGRSSKDVARVAASIIEDLRFVDVDQTFDLICSLYRGAEGEEADAWIKLAGELAKHHMHVWQQAGPVVQGMLMDRVMAFSSTDKAALRPIILAIVREVFATDLNGTTSEGDTITFHSGAVVASDALRQMRADALALVYGYDVPDLTEEERNELIDILRAAMAMPSYRRTVAPELGAIVLSNAAEVVAYFTKSSGQWSYERRQKIENRLLWKYRNYGGSPPKEQTNDEQEAARKEMNAAILEFRDVVNRDHGFTTYKLLVGFESVFPPAWDDPEFDHEKEEPYRVAQIDTLIEGIDNENAAEWLGVIRRCAATKSNDLATFPSFSGFLQSLSARKPDIVFGYLAELDPRLANFLPSFLLGLAQGSAWDQAEAQLSAWIAEGKFLSDITFSAASVDAMSLDLLDAALDAAIAADDEPAILNSVRSISWREKAGDIDRMKEMFLKAVGWLARREEALWHHYWRSRKDNSLLMASLSADEAASVLDSLVIAPKIGSSLQWVLADVAAAHPQAVLDYVGNRIARRFADGRRRDYDAVPYDLHRLDKVLAAHADLVVASARAWYAQHPDYFSYYGGKFVEIVFPAFSAELEEAMT
ncbi:hypothetical protein ACO2Q1_16340 [Brevundimonas sp. VNH65]|uniref:hypothetical protein n=1 Tax=Brevundimonas sp. VNH65 TaxID=3400917 RepID=UPI003C0501CD